MDDKKKKVIDTGPLEVSPLVRFQNADEVQKEIDQLLIKY